MDAMRDERKFLRPSQLQGRFGISRTTAYRWAKQGHIKVYKFGRSISWFKASEIESYIESLGGQLGG